MSRVDDTPNDPPKRGRPPRHTPDEVRDACVRAGHEAMREDGLDLRLDAVTIDVAAERAGVSRAMAYRAFKDGTDVHSGPLDRFRQAVTTTILTGFADTEDSVAGAALVTMVRHTGHDDLGDIALAIEDMAEAERCALFARVVAAGTFANLEALFDNSLWHARLALLAAHKSRGDVNDELAQAVAAGEADLVTRHVGLYRLVLSMFGMRLRDGFTMEHLAVAGACAAEGLGLRGRSPIARRVDRSTPDRASDEPPADWNLLGVASMALIAEICEADPDVAHATDPTRC